MQQSNHSSKHVPRLTLRASPNPANLVVTSNRPTDTNPESLQKNKPPLERMVGGWMSRLCAHVLGTHGKQSGIILAVTKGLMPHTINEKTIDTKKKIAPQLPRPVVTRGCRVLKLRHRLH